MIAVNILKLKESTKMENKNGKLNMKNSKIENLTSDSKNK